MKMKENYSADADKTKQEEWEKNMTAAYRREMEHIKRPEIRQESTLDKIHQTEQARTRRRRAVRTALAAAAMLCAVLCMENRSQIVGFAKSMADTFTLFVNGGRLELDSIEIISFDTEAFCSDSRTHLVEPLPDDPDSERDGKSYYQNFKDYGSMHSLTGLRLPNPDVVEYTRISVSINQKYGSGHLSMSAAYKDACFGINGMFAADGFRQEHWGYGVDDDVDEDYEYADGRHAYFIRYGEMDVVYFTESGIMFQMFLDHTEPARENAKNMLHAMAG